MTWHKTGKRTELDADGNLMMVHTSDGVAWKKFDELHADKAADPRHPRVGISTDGFSVFGMRQPSGHADDGGEPTDLEEEGAPSTSVVLHGSRPCR